MSQHLHVPLILTCYIFVKIIYCDFRSYQLFPRRKNSRQQQKLKTFLLLLSLSKVSNKKYNAAIFLVSYVFYLVLFVLFFRIKSCSCRVEHVCNYVHCTSFVNIKYFVFLYLYPKFVEANTFLYTYTHILFCFVCAHFQDKYHCRVKHKNTTVSCIFFSTYVFYFL